MDPFETRLTTTAQRLGWDEEVAREVRRRRGQLVSEPALTASEIAKKFELPESEEFELRVLGMRGTPPPQPDGTHFEMDVRHPVEPHAPQPDDPTLGDSKAMPKPPPTPPSRKPAPHVTYPPTQVASARESERALSGTTFREAVRVAHAASGEEGALNALVAKVAAIASLVGNAHRQGIVVRNLAPDNVLFGEAGEVAYVDPRQIPTPAYCSPEQARDPNGALSPASDVFALGCLLFEALTGTALFAQVGREATLKAIVDDDRRPLESPWPVDDALKAVLRRATAGSPGSRHANGALLAADLDLWLSDTPSDHPPLADFESHPGEAEALRNAAAVHRAEAAVLLAQVPPGARIEDKQPAWTLQDTAVVEDREAARLEREYVAALERELVLQPGDAGARKQLGDHLLRAHKALEDAGEDGIALEERMRALDPERFQSYLDGVGRLTLVTEPAGATVDLYRYELKDRRLWPTHVRTLGKTPIVDLRLEMGSYVCIVRHPDCADVRYPVLIRRRTHWHGRLPDASEPGPVVLPGKAALDEGDVYVPAGWFRCGGPAEANAMPRAWTWSAGFVIRRDPVWTRDYLTFLDDLERAEDPEVEQLIPRTPDGRPLVSNAGGTYAVLPDSGLAPDRPITGIPWRAASWYARWYGTLTGQPWRLPEDLEWEKAARGVDGRIYPWGNALDPLFACYEQSHAGLPHAVDATMYPADSSPYGVRGMAGNVRDWCRDSWQSREGIAAGEAPPVIAPTGPKVVRGGHYAMTGPGLVTWMRSRVDAATCAPTLGFRLVRRFPA